jgi:ribose transport system substrate-binding protein
MRKSNVLVHTLPVLLAALAGCGGGRHEATEVYYLVTANTKIAYWQEAAAGLNAAAKQLGVRSDLVGPETYDPQAQKQAFDKLVVTKPAGILVSPADPALMQGSIDAAVEQGIPVITVDSDSPGSKRLMFIGTNNYEAGQTGADVVAKQLNGKGNVVVYTILGQANLQERMDGYRRVFSVYPDIKIVETVDIKGDPVVAFESTKTILEKTKPQPDAFVCLEALACEEVAEVMDRNKVTGKTVVAMDTNQGTLEWIQKGVIAATIAQKPYTMAYFGLKVLDDLHHYKLPRLDASFAADTRAPVPELVDTGVTLVTKANVDAFLKPAGAAGQ